MIVVLEYKDPNREVKCFNTVEEWTFGDGVFKFTYILSDRKKIKIVPLDNLLNITMEE